MSAVRAAACRCVRAVINERLGARPWQSYTATWSCVRATSSISQETNYSKKTPLKKPKTPKGRFDEADESDESYTKKEPLERFPDDVNPVTKEKGGPRGPEPTRYGDWERKGRCIDF